ncbi:flagellar basal body-associated FliL family protein [Nocardioides sp. TF02-7]|uniref:flagellar basal body-associated FliL family protein n=1 Tax=Nocardioides sp. TF02-7 TaxID=2917724 RepID=UPI001F05D5CA|nr:flagellar basal body-associated FliL family protein [Nocardioides sp. TF02-7]UMG92257.1 flagellar basal body-associated FliL family protein [Nocardioides sp. TF02-7]
MSTTTSPASPTDGTRRGRPRIFILATLALASVAAAGYWFVLRPAANPAPPEPGEVLPLEPIQVNLAAGHYLRIGIALQLTADAAEPDGSRALDATIGAFSGLPLSKVDEDAERSETKKQLTADIVEMYDGEVMDLYFVEFVTQ